MNKKVRDIIIAVVVFGFLIGFTNIITDDIKQIDMIVYSLSMIAVTIFLTVKVKNNHYEYYIYSLCYLILFTIYVFTIGINVFSFDGNAEMFRLSYYSSFPRESLIPYYLMIFYVMSFLFQTILKTKNEKWNTIKRTSFFLVSTILNIGFLLYATVVIASV